MAPAYPSSSAPEPEQGSFTVIYGFVISAFSAHDKIYHIHWKDLGPEWLPKRGTIFGCGFSTIEVGTGCIDVAGVIDVLKDNKNIKYSTLEVGGSAELLRASAKYIEDRWNA